MNETTGYPKRVGVKNWHIMKELECYLMVRLESVLLKMPSELKVYNKKGNLHIRQ